MMDKFTGKVRVWVMLCVLVAWALGTDIFLLCLSPHFHPFQSYYYSVFQFKPNNQKRTVPFPSSPIILMQSQNQFKLRVVHVKQRLLKIVEHKFEYLFRQQKKEKRQILVLNEALLQEWSDMLAGMVYFKEEKKITSRATKVAGSLKNRHLIQKVDCISPQPLQQSSKWLLDIEESRIAVFEFEDKQERSQSKVKCKKSVLEFSRGLVHSYCSYVCQDSDKMLLIGGLRESDHNLKSHDILTLNLNSQEITKVGQLPYGISSHASQKIGNKVYIVGGNKNFSIVTKKCLQIDLGSYQVSGIADLNYPSASHCLLNWHSTHLYKFGGIGSCFGQWDLSPYIERYEILSNLWQVINPNINIDQNLLHHYSLLVNSMVYLSQEDTIVVLGGFDFEGQGSSKMFQISVRENSSEEEECLHQIVRIGEVTALVPGGFPSQPKVFSGASLLAIQTFQDPQEGLTTKIVSLSHKISYL